MKVVIDLSAGRLSIEGDGPELLKVLEAARSLTPEVKQIQIVTSREVEQQSVQQSSREVREVNANRGGKTLRQFARSLALENSAERIAAIAFYVNKIEGRPSFTPKEMDGWFTMCGFQKPSQMAMALFDARRKYGYAESSSRGAWRISNQGENLIIAKAEDCAG